MKKQRKKRGQDFESKNLIPLCPSLGSSFVVLEVAVTQTGEYPSYWVLLPDVASPEMTPILATLTQARCLSAASILS